MSVPIPVLSCVLRKISLQLIDEIFSSTFPKQEKTFSGIGIGWPKTAIVEII